MVEHIIYNTPKALDPVRKDEIASFLFQHLEQFGDEKKDIEKAMEYAMQEITSFGGFIVCAEENKELLGVVVVNRTGMKGYIPENILVYIATHKKAGEGVGKELMKKAMELAEGDVALHVEANNPALFLYEKLGFENKYLEMRYKKS